MPKQKVKDKAQKLAQKTLKKAKKKVYTSSGDKLKAAAAERLLEKAVKQDAMPPLILTEKEYRKRLKKCCHPDKRTCPDCPLKNP
jgi:hypothetical protein